MSVVSTQGYNFRLVANGQQLDLFKDETIKISNNVTGLFDVDILPADFSRTITLPGTKVNNAFFEHVYDISVNDPYLFETNVKVPAYFDFGGIYLVNGYLQLLKVNLYENKFIDSYEVSIFGLLSSFSRDLNRTFLTDLTGSLAQYNHTSNLSNIQKSWRGELFSGSVVYPLAEYGQKINYSTETFFGTDDIEGALNVQNFKPAIRVKAVWDAIFDTFGFTYTGSFWQQPWLNDVYLIANNALRYPEYANVDLETYGQIKISALSGSATSNVSMSLNVPQTVLWYNIEQDPSGFVGSGASYKVEKLTKLRGTIGLNYKVMGPTNVNGVPQFQLKIFPTGSSLPSSTTNLVEINQYMQAVALANNNTINTTYNLQTQFNTAAIPAGTYRFGLEYTNYGSSNFTVVLDPGDSPKSYLSVGEVCQAADFKTLEMAPNMPYGTSGIKCIDFIKGLQRKFNLIIYPSKTIANQFHVETFNNWYKQGRIKNFDNYINVNDKISVTPANNLAVNKLDFGDRLDTDYVSQQFFKGANREYGKTYYIDTNNFFSQGEFKVESGFASAPLLYVPGSALSGSQGSNDIIVSDQISISDGLYSNDVISCLGSSYDRVTNATVVTLLDDGGNPKINTGAPIVVTMRYYILPCYSNFGYPQDVQITIPYGQSSSTYYYYQSQYVDCGDAVNCLQEQQNINCIVSVTGQALPIYPSSPFNNQC